MTNIVRGPVNGRGVESPAFLEEERARHYAERVYILLKNGQFLPSQELMRIAEKEAYDGEDIGDNLSGTRLNPKLIALLQRHGIETIDDLRNAWPGKLFTIPRLSTVSHAECALELTRLGKIQPLTEGT